MNSFCSLRARRPAVVAACLGILIAAPSISAISAVPEDTGDGKIGWSYYIRTVPTPEIGHAATAEDACHQTALNHFDTGVEGMNRYPTSKPYYGCVYKGIFGAIREYTPTHLVCKFGFEARWPGICAPTAEEM